MIKIYSEDEVKQGTDEWLQLRAGKVTGTDAYSLIRGKSIEEILDTKSHSHFKGNYYTRRGHILEDEAKEIYTQAYEKVENAGFITNDKYPQAGYSPDGLVGEDGLVECKAFQPARHLKVYKNLDASILAQIQFGLFVSERKWCDLILYNPDMPEVEQCFLTKRIYPFEETQKIFENLLKIS